MAEALIDLTALRNNLRVARRLAPGSALLAVIKANAYGHGMLPVARALGTEAEGFAVARLEEGLALREAGIEGRIVLLSEHAGQQQLATCAQHRLDIVVHDRPGAERLASASLPAPISAWLKIDTGMHRLGIEPSETAAVHQLLTTSPAIEQVVLMSHLACAEEIGHVQNQRQILCFDQATDGLRSAVSIANSAAILTRPASHRDWVRPGIMLYGAHPLGEAAEPKLEAVMTLQAPLLAVRDVPAGESVGYNHTWTAPADCKVGTVAIGYGDGYPRHAPNGTPVVLNGRRAPLAGRVSMDTLTIDLSDHGDAMPGDTVQLWGSQLPVNEVADCAGTIAYELLTRVTDRVAFRYRDSSAAPPAAK